MEKPKNLVKAVGVEIDGEVFILRNERDIAFVMQKISHLEPAEQNKILNEIFNKFMKIFDEMEEKIKKIDLKS